MEHNFRDGRGQRECMRHARGDGLVENDGTVVDSGAWVHMASRVGNGSHVANACVIDDSTVLTSTLQAGARVYASRLQNCHVGAKATLDRVNLRNMNVPPGVTIKAGRMGVIHVDGAKVVVVGPNENGHLVCAIIVGNEIRHVSGGCFGGTLKMALAMKQAKRADSKRIFAALHALAGARQKRRVKKKVTPKKATPRKAARRKGRRS